LIFEVRVRHNLCMQSTAEEDCVQTNNQPNGQSCASMSIRPSGNVTSSADSYCSGPSPLSSKGKSSQSPARKDAPTKFISPSHRIDNTPVVGSADSTTSPELPQCISIVSPCSSSISYTGPTVMNDSRSRHSFSLRNATSHETLFIAFAHMDGVRKAEWLERTFEWKFTRSVSDLLAVVKQLDEGCPIIDRKKAEA